MSGEDWYYCLRHERVERGPGCPDKERLGPYPSEDEATQALQIVAERNEAWDSDPRWRDDPE